MQKRFIIRKYIYAKNLTEAIKLDKKTDVMDAWLDEKWIAINDTNASMGFKKDNQQ